MSNTKITIYQAAEIVLKRDYIPMTISEIYHDIVKYNLYKFGAKEENKEHVVEVQVERYTNNTRWQKSQIKSNPPIFHRLDDGRYEVIEQENANITKELDYILLFDSHVEKSKKSTSAERKARLDKVPKKPEKKTVSKTIYIRNPDVVAEVLIRANGICDLCKSPAPFKKIRNGEPYLEVHHKIHLANDGDDTVKNSIALCPNCHREKHYG